jgi:hypothetical protein
MPDAIDKAMKVYLEKLGAPTDAPRSAGVPAEEESMEANFRDFLRRVGPRGGKTKALKDFAEAHTQRQLVSLEADNASLRASLAEFKGDYGKLVDLEGQAQARVAALEAERDRLREALAPIWEQVKTDAKYGDYIAFGVVDAQLDGKMLEAIRQALHPTSEAEL